MDPLDDARSSLEPDEDLVWAERPDPQVLARAKLPQALRGLLGLAVICGFLWFSFLPNWPAGTQGVLFAAFLAAACGYCVWLLAAPTVAKAAAGRIVYAVTDRRLFIREDWPFRRLRSFRANELDDPQVAPGAAGRGTVIFLDRKLPWWRRSAGGSRQIEAFFGIPDAERVAQAVARLKAGQGPGRESNSAEH
jgi:hypothetical protein